MGPSTTTSADAPKGSFTRTATRSTRAASRTNPTPAAGNTSTPARDVTVIREPESDTSPSARVALVRAVESRPDAAALRIACEPRDVALSNLAERIVALLDTHRLRATVVAPSAAADTSLRAVVPIAPDPALAIASFMAASAALAGDEAGASAIARTAPSARAAMVSGVWSRSAVAVLGRQTTSIHVRAGVRGVRFDAVGRLTLEDAWTSR